MVNSPRSIFVRKEAKISVLSNLLAFFLVKRETNVFVKEYEEGNIRKSRVISSAMLLLLVLY